MARSILVIGGTPPSIVVLCKSPTEPNDDDRKSRMKKALNELLSNWKDSEESALQSRFSKLPWRTESAARSVLVTSCWRQKAVAKVCSPGEDCAISMSLLRQMVLPAKVLASECEGPFVNFGQTEISLTNEAHTVSHDLVSKTAC